MSNESDLSQYGIGKQIVSITPFDGFDPSKLAAFKLDMSVYSFEKGITLSTSKLDSSWLEVKQIHYAEKANSSGKVTAAILTDPRMLGWSNQNMLLMTAFLMLESAEIM